MKRRRWWLIVVPAALLAGVWWATRSSESTSAVTPPIGAVEATRTDANDATGARELASAVSEATNSRRVHLELLRFPDEAPLDYVQVELAVADVQSESQWQVTDAAGRIDVDAPYLAKALDVRAAGFQPLEVRLGRSEVSKRVILTPTSGLFGRVVDSEHRPIGGAQVRLEIPRRVVQNPLLATRSHSEVGLSESRSIAATAVTNPSGFYYLGYAATATATERIQIVATVWHASGVLDVELPRTQEQLEDIVLSTQRSVAIHVVDTNAVPIAGAIVYSPVLARQASDPTTGENGVVVLPGAALPAAFFARAPGMLQIEQRFDGRAVARGAKVESYETQVELVLEPMPNLRVRVLDAQSREPIFSAGGRVEFLRGGAPVDSADFQVDAHGEARVLTIDSQVPPTPTIAFDEARITAEAPDYVDGGPVAVDLHVVPAAEPIDFLLQPEPGTVAFHGRVLSEGKAVIGMEMGVKVQHRSEGAQPRGWIYKRTRTDADGRFSVRWPRDSSDQIVSAFPHRWRPDEYAFVGPLDVDVATAREQVLELRTAVRAPAILRGVARGVGYCYFVSIYDGDAAVQTTINGVPIAVDTEGEARVTLLLPSDRRSRVSIGLLVGDGVVDHHESAIDFDPARPWPPLVFELQPFFADIAGHVVGFGADEIAHLSVAFAASKHSQVRTARCHPDATFRLTGIPRGSGELVLLLDGNAAWQATVLARMPLTLQGNVDDLPLARDPSSLPVSDGEQR
jgi:hypothetical protein